MNAAYGLYLANAIGHFFVNVQILTNNHAIRSHWILGKCPSVFLRLVHTERIIRSSIGQFLRTRKTWSVRKFSILLRKSMRFMQVWMSLYTIFILSYRRC